MSTLENDRLLDTLAERFEEYIKEPKVKDAIEDWLFELVKEEYLSLDGESMNMNDLFYNIGISL